MEAIYSSETSVDSQRTTRRYIPEDSTLKIRPSYEVRVDAVQLQPNFSRNYEYSLHFGKHLRIFYTNTLQRAKCFHEDKPC
jgi:hypothetical protein